LVEQQSTPDLCPHCGQPIPDEEREGYGTDDAGVRRAEDRARWMKAATRELEELIASVEGRNPQPARRRRR
jgi:hypothetical protein